MGRRRFLFLLAAVTAVGIWILPLRAEVPPPGVKHVTSADTYTTVTIELEGPTLFGSTTNGGTEGTGLLTFTSSGGPAISEISGGPTTYTLTFASTFTPHITVITINGGTAYLADGAPVTVGDEATPFSPADLAALVGGLGDLPAIPTVEQLGLPEGTPSPYDLPFVQDWFDQAMALKDVFPALGSFATTGKTEAEVVEQIKGLAGGVVSDITFSGRVATFTFDDEKTAWTRELAGTAGVDSIGVVPFEVSLTGTLDIGAGLDGSVAIQVDRADNVSTAKFSSASASVILSADATFTPEGQIGVVDVSAPGTQAAADVTIDLGLACGTGTPCAIADMAVPTVTIGGSASLDVTQVDVTFAGQTQQFKLPGEPTASLLELSWADLADPTVVTAPVDQLNATKLRGFTSVSVGDIAGGLQWVATWLAEVEEFGDLAGDLPVIGETAGALANLSATLSGPTLALGQLLGVFGDLSAQDLLLLCDPDGIADRIDDLSLELEDLQSLLPGEGDDAADLLAKLKAAAVAVATECEPLLGGVGYDAAAHAITYTVEFSATHALKDLLEGGSLDLGIAEATGLDGISVAVRGGNWDSSSAAVDFELTFGVKLGTHTELGIADGVLTTDFDGDGEPNSTDTDIDGDGLPERFTFEEGDRCRGLASLFGTSVSALQSHFGITAPTRNPDGTVDQTEDMLCDEKLTAGTAMSDLQIGGDGDAVATLTDAHVCAAAAARFGLTAGQLIGRNGSTTTIGSFTRTGPILSSTADCAAAVKHGGTDGEYNFDDTLAMTPKVALPHRIYVSAAEDVVSVTLRIEATGLGAHADLGILDLDVDVTKLLLQPTLALELRDPTAALELVDPTADLFPKDDGKIDLWEMATKADAGELLDLLDLSFSGPIEVKVNLHNQALMGNSPKGIDVFGDLADLGGGFAFHSTRLSSAPSEPAGKIHVGHDLGDLVNLKDITAAQALRMVLGVIEKLAELGDSSVMSTTIPFVEVTPQDMVDFTRSLADVLQRVEDRDPEDISALEAALNDALVAAGMPGNLTIEVDADELRLRFDASRSITRTYPFSFDTGAIPDLGPLSFAPADGGASVTATAGVTFNPTIGIKFDDGPALDQRIFLRGVAPAFDVAVDADIFGSVHLGPALAAVRGTASVGGPGPELEVVFKDGSGNTMPEVTLGQLATVLANPGTRIGVNLSGPFDADFDVAATVAGLGTVTGGVNVAGNLDPNLGPLTVTTRGFDNFVLKLDLNTFVNGASAGARFVGRTLQQSEAISADLPFLGDELRTLATVGADLRRAADQIDALWKSLEDDPNKTDRFVDDVEAHLDDNVCAVLTHLGDCDITVALLPDDAGTTIANATGFEIGLRLGASATESFDLGAGLDLDVFALDLDVPGSLTFGYGLDVVFGINLTDGFYLRPGDSMGSDFLQLYAGMNVPTFSAGVDILGLSATVTNGSVTIGGGLNNDTAGGFAVGLADGKTSLRMTDLTNRRTKLETIVKPRFDLDIKAHLPLVVAVQGIADLVVPVHFSLVADGLAMPQPTLVLGCRASLGTGLCPSGDQNITLDATAFVTKVIKPIFGDILGDPAYNPLGQPSIKEALDAEIPVLETKVRTIMREAALLAGKHAEWTLIEFLVDVGNMSFDCDAQGLGGSGTDCFDGKINLGWAEILPSFTHHTPQEWGIPAALTNLIENLQRISGSIGLGGASTAGTNGSTTASSSSLLSFPILDNPGSAIKLILGGELNEPITFVEFNAPPVTLGKSINFSRTLFNLNIGFLKGGLSVALRGSLGLELQAGFGYDSTGISTGNPLDGFYLVDYDGFEVALGASISGMINGRFSVIGGIASVRFRGSAGARLQAGLDLFDDSIALPRHSRNNGKLHLWEIGVLTEAYGNPLCMFGLGVRFDAYLAFSGKAKVLGVTVFNKSWRGVWVLVDERLTCTLIEVPAHIDDNRRLVLNGGTFANFRFSTGAKAGDQQEHFTLTKTGNGDIKVDLTMTGHAGTISKTFDHTKFDEIYAELGAGPNSVAIADAITLPATLIGGPDDDTMKGGGGDDLIDGGGGNNTLSGGPGDDLILGGDGDDVINGGPGDDTLDGGSGSNTYKFDDAWGDDTINDAGADATLDFTGVTTMLTGRVAFDEATVTSTDASLTYWADEVSLILGGTEDDDFELNRYYQDAFRIDLRGGSDTVTIKFSGINRTITVDDTGSGAEDVDHLVVLGTAADDVFLFRADGPDDSADGAPKAPATQGFIAMGARDHLAGLAEMAADKAAAEAAALDSGETFDAAEWEANYTKNQARLHLLPNLIDRVDYNDKIEKITARGVAGRNHFYLDDAAAAMTINTGDGGNVVQVGQIYRLDRVAPQVAPGDEVRTRGTFVGFEVPEDPTTDPLDGDYLSYGISHPTEINGGRGNDRFTVYSNRDQLNLNGISGDNVFIIRAFVLDGTVEAIGGDGNDKFEYVQNELVKIDGGDGFNTMIIVGTPFSDGFILGEDGIDVCPITVIAGKNASTADPKERLPDPDGACGIDVEYTRIQSVVVHGLYGNNVFWVRSSDPGTHYQLYGGRDGATFYVHDPNDGVTGVAGPVTIEGEFDPKFDISLRKPVVLPGTCVAPATPCGEDGTPALGTIPVGYDRMENWLLVDASTHTTSDEGWITDCTGYLACRDDASRVVGLGMGDGTGGFRDSVDIRVGTDRSDPDAPVEVVRAFPTGLVYHTIDELTVELGTGSDLFTVHTTHTSENLDSIPTVTKTLIQGGPGNDEIHVKTIDGPTTVEGGAGDDTIRVGTELPLYDGRVNGIRALLHVDGGEDDGGDGLWLDDTGNASDDTVDITDDTITGLGMAGHITYTALEVLDVDLGDHDEVVNVQGTSAVTTVHGNDGDEHFYVSSVAALSDTERILGDTSTSELIDTHLLAGHLDDVAGDLHLDAGAGRHLLMVSDRATATGDGAVAMTEGSITGLAAGGIFYDADGNYAAGITVWTSDEDDTVSVTGSRRDDVVRTITTLNTGTGDDHVTVELDSDDGMFVVNLEDGDDTLVGGTSTLGLVVFGGDGDDTITTGAGRDVVFGDQGRVEYYDTTGTEPVLVTSLGAGGDGDFTDGVHRAVGILRSVDPCDGGNDVIHTGGGNDVAYGGAGDDVLYGGDGNDVLLGDHGRYQKNWGAPKHRSLHHDSDEVCAGDDTLYGGAGDDRLMGQQGDDRLFGNGSPPVGEDVETVEEFRDRISGAGVIGANTLIGGHDGPAGLDGDDLLIGGEVADTIIGDNGKLVDGVVTIHDLACADSGADCADVGGDDIIRGVDGTNRLYGGVGDDYIVGGAGFDYAEGGPGNDWLEGGAGNDDLIGGSSFERTNGRGYVSGNDTIFGTAGENVILGDNGRIERDELDDAYFATDGRWIIAEDRWIDPLDIHLDTPDAANGGDDVISGGAGNSIIFGLLGDDWISGGGGGDYIEGNAGDDVIVGDRHFDLSVAGEDTDRVVNAALSDLPNLARRDGNFEQAGPSEVAFPGIGVGLLELRDMDPLGATPWADAETIGPEGVVGTHGPDDIIGGSSAPGLPDGNDVVYGDGSHDFILGDNGRLVRLLDGDDTAYELYHRRYPDHDAPSDAIKRRAVRFDVGASVSGPHAVYGDDWLDGGAGNDTIYGQDGDDEIWGGDGDDHLFGELGDDRIFGGPGDDVLIGDRGSVVTVFITGETEKDKLDGEILALGTMTFSSPPFLEYVPFVPNRLYHRVDLLRDLDNTLEAFSANLPYNGHDHGGNDLLRGGKGHDALYGGAGDDLMNGDSGGDILFGGDGNDALWGGIGHPTDNLQRDADPQDGGKDRYVDYLFGGDGEDIHDFTPRQGIDWEEGDDGQIFETTGATGWVAATHPYWHPDVAEADRGPANAEESRPQHRQGTDWMWGGKDRDIFQGDLSGNGPNEGDRMIDWSGAFNLYTHCNSAYGGHNNLRSSSPAMVDFLETLAWTVGAGSQAEVKAAGSSGFRNLSMIYRSDNKNNSGKAHDGSPGNFFDSVADCDGD